MECLESQIITYVVFDLGLYALLFQTGKELVVEISGAESGASYQNTGSQRDPNTGWLNEEGLLIKQTSKILIQ